MPAFNDRLLLLLALRSRIRIRAKNLTAQKRKHRFWVRPTLQRRTELGHFHQLMPELESNDREWFYKYLRMSPERFQHLVTQTKPYLTKRCWNRTPISAAQRLAITLRYLSSGDSQLSIAFGFVVGIATVSKIVREGCSALWKALQPTYLKVPTTVDAWKEVANDFLQMWDLPHVVGAVDGKHIAIECPANGGSDYYNYKGFNSINLMAMCDASYRFLYVNIGGYGRENDAAIFSSSDLYASLDNNRLNLPPPENINGFELPYVVVGDEIFALKQWLLKPYPGRNLPEPEVIFNYRLSRARRTIENAFGILSCRWRIFRRPFKAKLDLVDAVVKACVCLHNYLLLTDTAKYTPAGFADSYSGDGDIIYGEWRKTPDCGMRNLPPQGSNNFAAPAKQVRNKFRDYVNSQVGSVPWQEAYVRNSGRVELD